MCPLCLLCVLRVTAVWSTKCTKNHRGHEELGSLPGTQKENSIFAAMKYTQTTLSKIESMIHEAGYILRYERGSFQSGFCILEDRKVVVLNKFLQLEGKINTLIDLIGQLKIDAETLTPESKKWYADAMLKVRGTDAAEE